MKIGIIGAGLIGGYLGARLAEAGLAVTLVGRRGFCEEVQTHGLSAVDVSGRVFRPAADRLVVTTDPAALGSCDQVLVTVKSAQTAEVAAQLEQLPGERPWVVSFQNGVRNPEILRARLGERVLAGMVPFNVVRSGPGVFQQATTGVLMVERRGPAEALVAAIHRAGLKARSDPRITEIQWGKLLLNLNNALNALSDLPLREELLDPGYRGLLADCIHEGVQLLKRLGIRARLDKPLPPSLLPVVLRLPTPLFRVVAGSMLRIDPKARSSLWEDLSRGRPTEIDFLNGELVDRARELGLPAPINEAVVRMVRSAEGKSSPRLSAQQLRQAASAG